ncbi:MAG: SAM-dependent methyltransferase [Flavobacteriales bacterium]|nr:SAM-dependent methyltransferase [Flavobacteriales bacterium]
MLQTAERSSHLDPSENVIFQRHLIAYKEAAKLINGIVLEVGSGEGYGIVELADKAQKYIAIDKYDSPIEKGLKEQNNIEFHKMNVPPLKFEDNSIDFVVTFQVIEHIKDDEKFVQEIHRVLKPGGKLILTTPNILMSLSRNPWHIREYNPTEMKDVLKTSFSNIKMKGIYGNEKVMKYYEKNKKSVENIRKWDIFNLEKKLPRLFLQIPYDILNRFNRHKLQDNNEKLVGEVKYTDYFIKEMNDTCLDYFCIATKV